MEHRYPNESIKYREARDDKRQYAKMNVCKKVDESIFHFWGTEIPANDIDMVWPYWNLMDLTPAGRPDRSSPPQEFRSVYLEENYSSPPTSKLSYSRTSPG